MINDEIREKEVRLIGEDGSQLGVLPITQAQEIADAKNLDLVKIAPQANPPVCKIMDYGKYKFEIAKREREAKKNQNIVTVKEIKMSPSIDTNDFNTKVNHAIKFLKAGDKIKVSIRFRGREINHSALGVKLLERFTEAVSEYATAEKKPKFEGRNMFVIVAPK